MTQKDPVLLELARALTAAAESEDLERIADFLRGRHLPALGDAESAAEKLERALAEVADPDVLRQLACLLGRLIERFTAEESSTPDAKRRAALMNAVQLAAELPADAALASALRSLLALLSAAERGTEGISRFELAVHRALVYQQVDPASEVEWLAILWGLDRDQIQWTAERRTLLLTAWRGLLWIPPGTELLDAGEVLDKVRVEQGLIAFHRAVSGHEEGRALIRLALDILTDTYPRSVEFWEELVRPAFPDWPEELQQEAAVKWPGLKSQLESRTAALVWSYPFSRDGASMPWLPATSVRSACLNSLFSTVAPWRAGLRAKDIAKIRYGVFNFLAREDDGSSTPLELPAMQSEIHFTFGSYVSHVFAEPVCLFSLSSCSASREGETACLSFLDILDPNSVRADAVALLLTPRDFSPMDPPRAIEQLSRLKRTKAQEAHLSQELADYLHSTHRQLSGHAAHLLLPGGENPYALQETVVQRKDVPLALDLGISVSLSLLCHAPLPLPYLQNLYALSSENRHLAISQLRRLRLRSWNPLERSYLGAILTLAALKESDFVRALQELETQTLRRTPPSIEHQVLELHAHAGAGQWRPSENLFFELEGNPSLQGAAKKTVQLLDSFYGFSGSPSRRPGELHERIIESEADMLAAAGVS